MAQTAEASRGRRFLWTDKAALAAGFALLALIGALWLFAFVTIGAAGAQHVLQKSGASGLALAALATGSLWVVLQGVDFAARGIARLFMRYRGRARLAEGSLIDGRPFRGTITAALPFEATQALAPMVARPPLYVRTRSNAVDLRSRPPETLEAL
jgi:hypothetical protein